MPLGDTDEQFTADLQSGRHTVPDISQTHLALLAFLPMYLGGSGFRLLQGHFLLCTAPCYSSDMEITAPSGGCASPDLDSLVLRDYSILQGEKPLLDLQPLF